MKNLILPLIVLGILGFTSCGDDEGSGDCQTCTTTAAGASVVLEYCDNGDGTFNTYTDGVIAGENVTLNGQSFSTFMDAVAASPTTTCD